MKPGALIKPVHISLLLLVAACEPGEEKPVSLHHTALSERVYYDFSDNIHKRYDTTGNFHDAAVQLAQIGRHFDAIKVYDKGQGNFPRNAVFIDPSLFLAVPAIDYIVSEAAKNQVVLINEEHHVSTHRFFTLLLLKRLYQVGYRYFGAETINFWDTTLNERNYPTLNTGYYTAEPQYGNLVREAMQAGFNAFAYEAGGGKNGMLREMEQARNIERILKDDSTAKILIHCGYGHIVEGEVQEWGKAMAGRLREYTGIDPLTVDQVELTEHSAPELENPYYQGMQYDDFVVVLQKNNLFPLRFRDDGSGSDVFVYHPRTRLKHNRPHWLFGYYEPVFINTTVDISFPVIARAFIAGEDSSAVPADVIEINNREDSTALALKPNSSYRIQLNNKKGQKQVIALRGNLIKQ